MMCVVLLPVNGIDVTVDYVVFVIGFELKINK